MTKQRSFGKQELAMHLLPSIHPVSASRQLSRWIERDPDLLADLQKSGYVKGQRMFTPKQVDILSEHLGIEIRV